MREEIIQARGYSDQTEGDVLSLKIASYPTSAQYLARRLASQGDTICELCCGIGVSLIELVKTFDKVIGVDNDHAVIDACKVNLDHAGVINYDLVTADISARTVLSNIQADIVLYDIPYWSSHDGKVDPDTQNPNLQQVVRDIQELITDKIVIYTPPHMPYEEVGMAVGECEYMQVWIDGKHDRNFAFLGSLTQNIGTTKITLTTKV